MMTSHRLTLFLELAAGVFALGCGGGGTSSSGHTFACGDLMCNSATETCSIINGNLPGEAPSYTCKASDGGPPSCGGMNSATAPGQCGCYESPSGEVTTALCPP